MTTKFTVKRQLITRVIFGSIIAPATGAFLGLTLIFSNAQAQDNEEPVFDPDNSVARNWNEAALYGIRRDLARPTVHARNLFHASTAMYDSWALYADTPSLYFMGRELAPDGSALPGCAFSSEQRQSLQSLDESEKQSARQTTLSYAMYRLLSARFADTPGAVESLRRFEALLVALGFDSSFDSTDISEDIDPARLGNYLAKCVIDYGRGDGSNESNQFENRNYTSSNPPLDPNDTGAPGLNDPNRWQSLMLDTFIDQSGNESTVPVFVGAEWSEVASFALTNDDITQVERDGTLYPAFMDPGPPSLLGDDPVANSAYQLGHAMVAKWSSHLDPSDGVMWDISPGNLGNVQNLPESGDSVLDFYDALQGGSKELGYAVNPVTGGAYAEELVPRGDFTRVLAEFWADGPTSETPPGHWFQIYNTLVSDHPMFTRNLAGASEESDPLEYDVRAYMSLGGAMHDSAIAAWSIKAAYDYIRPISALRYMASLGQSTDLNAANYNINGIPLEPGFIESVLSGDPLAGNGGVNVGKIKARTWRGPNLIGDPLTSAAGVGWTLLENWWPYQRPSFVTPPFAGYVSGHSTFSRAAADVLTSLTGSEYFPGGLATFTAKKDEFLVFENGPSVDVTLQWASYRDASDQTSLSRIWGGIHPPVDDIPGRRIGSEVAERTLALVQQLYDGSFDNNATVPLKSDSKRDKSSSGCSIAAGATGHDEALFWLLLIISAYAIRPGCQQRR